MIATEMRTVIIYEAPHRLIKTLEFLEEFIQDRKVAICRELTKTHEEVRRGTVAEHISHFTENEPRGEFVLLVGGVEEVRSKNDD